MGVVSVKRRWSMAEVSFAWLSVTVKRGTTTVIPRKIVWDNVFGELLTAANPDLHSEIVARVSISKNEILCTLGKIDTV